MFCNKCGQDIIPGKKFCQNCGEPVVVRPPAQQQATAPVRKKSFFKTPAGIVLIAATCVVVIGGAVVGVILATRGGEKVMGVAEFKKVYVTTFGDFLSTIEEMKEVVDENKFVTDLNEQTTASEIAVFRKSLSDNAVKFARLAKEWSELEPPEDWKKPYESLGEAMDSYAEYIVITDGMWKVVDEYAQMKGATSSLSLQRFAQEDGKVSFLEAIQSNVDEAPEEGDPTDGDGEEPEEVVDEGSMDLSDEEFEAILDEMSALSDEEFDALLKDQIDEGSEDLSDEELDALIDEMFGDGDDDPLGDELAAITIDLLNDGFEDLGNDELDTLIDDTLDQGQVDGLLKIQAQAIEKTGEELGESADEAEALAPDIIDSDEKLADCASDGFDCSSIGPPVGGIAPSGDTKGLKLRADGGPEDYTIVASVDEVGDPPVELELKVSGEYGMSGDAPGFMKKSVDGTGKVTWRLRKLKPEGSLSIKVTRQDTKATATITIGPSKPPPPDEPEKTDPADSSDKEGWDRPPFDTDGDGELGILEQLNMDDECWRIYRERGY